MWVQKLLVTELKGIKAEENQGVYFPKSSLCFLKYGTGGAHFTK